MKRKYLIVLITTFALGYCSLFLYSLSVNKEEDELLIRDVSRIIPVRVQEIVQSEQESGLVEAILRAKEDQLKVSIAGARHSQGGHIFYEDALLLDMTTFNEILSLDVENKTIRVQSGATWEQIQDYINPYGLSIKVMQSSNIFTVGGSLSANAHGRDIRFGPIIETVNSFRLLQADGTILEVSRELNAELFSLVIGGYGLFGVILDVDLQLTDHSLYEIHHEFMDYAEYLNYFRDHVLGNSDVELHIARLSTAPHSFLKEMYASNYVRIEGNEEHSQEAFIELNQEENVGRNKLVFGLARKYDWGKNRLWDLQKALYSPQKVDIITRNNAMRPEVKFLDYVSENDTDILQEYFIPMEHFASFIDGLRDLVTEEELNLFNITVRYVPENEEATLSYAQKENLAIVLLINQGLSEKSISKTEQATQRIVDLAVEHDGTYYLAYQLYPSLEQMKRVYPNTETFFEKKREYDPEERFMNKFYERYGTDE